MGSIRSGRANENRKAIEENWPFKSDDKPRCDCGALLARYEVGICTDCSAGHSRPDA